MKHRNETVASTYRTSAIVCIHLNLTNTQVLNYIPYFIQAHSKQYIKIYVEKYKTYKNLLTLKLLYEVLQF